jgi:hypothetical protein
MPNHIHLVIKLMPHEAESWTDNGVLDRWTHLSFIINRMPSNNDALIHWIIRLTMNFSIGWLRNTVTVWTIWSGLWHVWMAPWLVKRIKKMGAPVTFGKAGIDCSTGSAGSFEWRSPALMYGLGRSESYSCQHVQHTWSVRIHQHSRAYRPWFRSKKRGMVKLNSNDYNVSIYP